MAEPAGPPNVRAFLRNLLGQEPPAAPEGDAEVANPLIENANHGAIEGMGTHFTTILNTMYQHIVDLQRQIAEAQAARAQAAAGGAEQVAQVAELRQQIAALTRQLRRVEAAAAQLNAYRNFYTRIFGAFKDIYTVSDKRGEGNAVKQFIVRLFTGDGKPRIDANANANDAAAGRVGRRYVGGNKTSFSLKRSEKRTESLINKANTLINRLKTKVNKAILLTKKSPLMNKILKTMNSKIKNIPQSKSSKSSNKKTVGGKRKSVKSKSKSKSKSVKRKSKPVKRKPIKK